MDQYTTKALIIVLSIVSRLFFGFTPLFVSKKLLTNKTTDSLTSKTVKITDYAHTSNCKSPYVVLFNVLVGISGFIMLEFGRWCVASYLFCSFNTGGQRESYHQPGKQLPPLSTYRTSCLYGIFSCLLRRRVCKAFC